jgi:hypothetical protein
VFLPSLSADVTVWQLLALWPSHFEFSSSLLLFLLDSVYSCRFGSFLASSQRERVKGTDASLLATTGQAT